MSEESILTSVKTESEVDKYLTFGLADEEYGMESLTLR